MPDQQQQETRWYSVPLLWLLLILVSLLVAPVPGINEPHYLAKARSVADSEWCKHDFFVHSGNAHFLFLHLVGPLTGVLSFPVVAVCGRILSLGLFAYGWHRLSQAFRLTASVAVLSLSMFAVFSVSGNFSGEWIIGGFEAKVPAYGLILVAMASVCQHFERVGIQHSAQQSTVTNHGIYGAGVCCGLAAAIHPVVGGWAICSFAGAILMAGGNSGREKIAQTMRYGLISLLFSLPGTIPALLFLKNQDVSRADADAANFYQVFWRLRHHLDPVEIPRRGWIWAASLLSILILIAVSLLIQSRRSPRVRSSLRGLWWILILSATIAGIGTAVGWHNVPASEMTGWKWRATILKFYPFRLFDGLLPVVTALTFGVAFQKQILRLKPDAGRLSKVVSIGLAFAMTVGAVLTSLDHRNEVPAGYTRTQQQDWLKACAWIEKNTSADSLFLTPRESYAFKWFAQRAEYACYKDCPQDAAGIVEWNRRLWYLHDWTLRSSEDESYTVEELQQLRRETGITHIVTRILGPFEASPVFVEGDWQIIEIPQSGVPVEQ
ncbi:MAG: hypothetical protein JNL58_00070 [Planctomyces sp.]|nr:hypothetical protein [Planctomyces sp.]